MVQNLAWATGYNVVAIPLAAGVLASLGLVLAPAMGALLMSASTVVVALNAQLLRRDPNLIARLHEGDADPTEAVTQRGRSRRRAGPLDLRRKHR
jgi:P-type Cu2+ transporter